MHAYERRVSERLCERPATLPCVLWCEQLSSPPHAAPWAPWFGTLFWLLRTGHPQSARGPRFLPDAREPHATLPVYLPVGGRARLPGTAWRTAFVSLVRRGRGHRPAGHFYASARWFCLFREAANRRRLAGPSTSRSLWPA